MAKGKCWAKDAAAGWVHAWWESGLTSAQFVQAEGLPISARSLRAHARRRFGEILEEWKALRACADRLAAQTVPETSLEGGLLIGAPDRVVSAGTTTNSALLVTGHGANQIASQPLRPREAFDFTNVPDQVVSTGASAGRASEPFDWT